MTVCIPQSNPATINPRVKSLNYLKNIMAKISGHVAGVEEVVMLNQRGEVAECSGDNLFAIKNGAIRTPPVESGLLEGCTRNTIIDLARAHGIEMRETVMNLFDLYTADEVFLTGTAAEVIPVVKVDGRVIGTGIAGEMTTKLLGIFRQYIADYKDNAAW